MFDEFVRSLASLHKTARYGLDNAKAAKVFAEGAYEQSRANKCKIEDMQGRQFDIKNMVYDTLNCVRWMFFVVVLFLVGILAAGGYYLNDVRKQLGTLQTQIERTHGTGSENPGCPCQDAPGLRVDGQGDAR
jgi:hypothetical protein